MPTSSKKHETDTYVMSVGEFQDIDGEDFITDPDQFRDRLPQPYRCIDKILNNLIDDAWEIIASREYEREKEASKFKPPKYECSVKLEEHVSATAISVSEDGQYVFVALLEGLAAVSASSQQTVSVWEESSSIVSIQCASLIGSWCSVATIDEAGMCRIYALAGEQIFLLCSLNDQDVNAKILAKKHVVSAGSEYIAFSAVGDNDNYVDVHKTPKDQWISELEAIVGPAVKQEQPPQSPVQKPAEPSEVATEGGGSDQAPGGGDGTEATESQVQSHRSQSPHGSLKGRSSPAVNAANCKFSPTTAILRVRAPTNMQGVNWSSAFGLSKTIDTTGDVIGSGVTHMISAQHLEQRWNTFQTIHQHHMKYLPENIPQPAVVPTFHFLRPGQAMIHATDKHLQEEPTSICVWWTEHRQICHYSLQKIAKDLEHKADVVWPQPEDIVATVVSPCTTLLAIVHSDNNVVIWDRYLGLMRRVVHIESDSQVTNIQFLDPVVCPQSSTNYPPYGTHTNVYLMCVCEDSEIYVVRCGPGETAPPQVIYNRPDKICDQLLTVEPIRGIPELSLVCRKSQRIFVQETVKDNVLCEVTLPEGFSFVSTDKPMVVSANNGKMLCIKGENKPQVTTTEGNSTEPEADTAATAVSDATHDVGDHDPLSSNSSQHQEYLFVFHLRSFPTLDQYHMVERPQIPYTIHNTIENRVLALMKERVNQQAQRYTRLQTRWDQMQKELQKIHKMKEQKQHNPTRPVISAGSVAKSLPITDASSPLLK